MAAFDALEAKRYPDGTLIRLIPEAEQQTVAEITLPPGTATRAHYHRTSEEVFLFRSGAGRMSVGERELDVAAGDYVVVDHGAGNAHKVWNAADEPLVYFCCVSPPYRDEDVVHTEGAV